MKSRKSRRRPPTPFSPKEGSKEAPFFEVGPASSPLFDGGKTLGLSGKGRPGTTVNFGNGTPVQLRGRTDADYSNNRWSLVDESGRQGSGCEGCSGRQCVEYSATVRSTFQVATNVTLPNIADYSSYSACQQQRIRDAINNELAPHEQLHVAAFQTYNGSVDTPITITGCRDRLANLAQERAVATHLGVERPRRASAQAASDALDPFVVNVDMNCT
jgi:hypothetical protein